MPDILNARATTPTLPRPHVEIDAILAAGRAAAARRDAHHAETLAIRRVTGGQPADAAGKGAA